jgi:hypothetical protein
MTRHAVLWEMTISAKCRLVATTLISPCDEHHIEKWKFCACVEYGKLAVRGRLEFHDQKEDVAREKCLAEMNVEEARSSMRSPSNDENIKPLRRSERARSLARLIGLAIRWWRSEGEAPGARTADLRAPARDHCAGDAKPTQPSRPSQADPAKPTQPSREDPPSGQFCGCRTVSWPVFLTDRAP